MRSPEWKENTNKCYSASHIGEGTRPDDLETLLGFRLPNTSGFLGSDAHQHFCITLHKFFEDANHLFPASRGLEVGAAGAVGFLKEVERKCQRPYISREKRIRLEQ